MRKPWSLAFAATVAALGVGLTWMTARGGEAGGAGGAERTFTVRPIGTVRQAEKRTLIVLDKKYEPGLLGLDGWSHVQVFWWFDRNDTPQQRAILRVHPRGDEKNPLAGVFATRSPVRPNLIALSTCKVVAVRENVIEVDAIDAFEGTPILDIKPYAPGLDAPADVKVPEWARRGRP